MTLIPVWKKQVMADGLTGLYHRRFLQETPARETSQDGCGRVVGPAPTQ